MITDWKGKRVLVLGAARQGLALARYLARKGALVTLNDKQPESNFPQIVNEMKAIGVKCVFGDHPLDLLDSTDLISISGGIPLDLPIIEIAKTKNIPLTNDSQILLESVTARVIGITGSAGKTTTTTLLGRMATEQIKPPSKAWIGGNIGFPLVENLDEIKPGDEVVLELSSFQLEQMTVSPQISAVLNITPNHLDRHGTLEKYILAKSRILQYQDSDGIAILNREDPGSWNLRKLVKGKLFSFGMAKPETGNGAFLNRDNISVFHEGHVTDLVPRELILLRGDHNVMNVLAACVIAYAAGYTIESIQQGIKGFMGVAHRLEFIRSWKGASWFNDSIATAPERTMAAINSFAEPLVVLLGGRDKDLPWDKLAALIHDRVDHVVIFGEAREKILRSLEPIQGGKRPYTIMICDHLKEAVQTASEIVEPGDVVLLSPGGTSFDEFKNFEERGERYREWVNQL